MPSLFEHAGGLDVLHRLADTFLALSAAGPQRDHTKDTRAAVLG